MCGLSEKGNRMRFVHPCLAPMESKVPDKDYRRVNDFQEPPRTKIGDEVTISSCASPIEQRERRRAVGRRYAHDITIRVQLKKFFLWQLGLPRRLGGRKWRHFCSVNIIVAETMNRIFAVSPL